MEAFLVILLRRSWWTRQYFIRESEKRNWRGISQWKKHFQSEIKRGAFYLQRKPKSSHNCTELLMYGVCSNFEIVKVLKFIVISKIRKTQEDSDTKLFIVIISYFYIVVKLFLIYSWKIYVLRKSFLPPPALS